MVEEAVDALLVAVSRRNYYCKLELVAEAVVLRRMTAAIEYEYF